ncbi:uncharacterized protein [Spinacia oleracea]|uniref:Uncharacterized protein isoform X2 n=1 Tax=Spinacia oleracea TaxID=3562 RepID=A0A9R0IFJ2_SPIOL|nr:uncharacterized protein LOC110788038 isoform X2 [Spinacia oleracea]
MERDEKNLTKSPEPEFVLQWGKRLRCVRVKNPNFNSKSAGGIRQKITSRIVTDDGDRINSSSEPPENAKSPEKEERYYLTRGSSVGEERENGKAFMAEGNGYAMAAQERGSSLWPKLFISLSSKEKEEDFLAMKGCKLPQRPKKRAKLIQRTLLLVSPGAWLSDTPMCQERYEVKEKKTPKKRPRGLKAMGMGTMESDSE